MDNAQLYRYAETGPAWVRLDQTVIKFPRGLPRTWKTFCERANFYLDDWLPTSNNNWPEERAALCAGEKRPAERQLRWHSLSLHLDMVKRQADGRYQLTWWREISNPDQQPGFTMTVNRNTLEQWSRMRPLIDKQTHRGLWPRNFTQQEWRAMLLRFIYREEETQ